MGYPDHENLMISSYFQYNLLIIIISFSLLLLMSTGDYDKFIDDDNLITFGCETGLNGSKNSSNYIQNVVYVVDDIASNAPKEDNRYKKATYNSFDGTDSVYGLAQCRGDVSEEDCSMCLNNASISTNNLCPGNDTNGAMVIRDKCFFMYEDKNFFQQPYTGKISTKMMPLNCSHILYNKTSDVEAISVVSSLLESLQNNCTRTQMKFASGSNTTADGSHVLQAMVECRRDLDVNGCTRILSEVTTSLLYACGNHTEGGYFVEGSYVRFAWKIVK